MNKYHVETKEIKADDGTITEYNVLSKRANVNVIDADTGRKYGVQTIDKQSIWFAPEDKDEIIEALNRF